MSKEKCSDCKKKIFYVETTGYGQRVVRCNNCKKILVVIKDTEIPVGADLNVNDHTTK